MSSVTVSTKRRRVYARKFDHEEARRLYAQGATQSDIARRFGVSPSRIGHVVNPAIGERVQRSWKEWTKAICDDCGGPCSHNWSSKHQRHDRVVCKPCADIRSREEYLLSRLNSRGDILCAHCGEHRSIEDYRIVRDFPAGRCRPCESAARRAYREAHREEDRAWQREYQRRRRESTRQEVGAKTC